MRRSTYFALAGLLVLVGSAINPAPDAMPARDLRNLKVVWQTPFKVPMNQRLQITTPKYAAAVIFGSVGAVDRVIVMQPSGATERKLLNKEPLYPGEKCDVYFDGIPTPGAIITIPTPVEGDHCRPMLWNFFVSAWGPGKGTAVEVYVCESYTDYNEGGTAIKPCCQIMPGGCVGGAGSTTRAATPTAFSLKSVWRTTQVHTFGGFAGRSSDFGIVVKEVNGDKITAQLSPPFTDYTLKGEMKGNVYSFEIYRSGSHHGKGSFTFTGNTFEGKWSDDWQKGGTWHGDRVR